MEAAAVAVLLFFAYPVSAEGYTGICFLDAVINTLDGISAWVSGIVNPTTTTTTTTTSTTTTTTSTTTTTAEETTTTTTSTTSTTTTAPFTGECMSKADCPNSTVTYTCDLDNRIIITTTNFVCLNPGPQSRCEGRMSSRIHKTCIDGLKCVRGVEFCVKPWEVANYTQ